MKRSILLLILFFGDLESSKWIHEKTPKQLIDMLWEFRKELDSKCNLGYGDKCDDSQELYKSYNKFNDLLYKDNLELFEMISKKEHFDSLMAFIEGNGVGKSCNNGSGFFCPITKGMICRNGTKGEEEEEPEEKRCRCIVEDKIKYKAQGAKEINSVYDEGEKICNLRLGSFCKGRWEIKCDGRMSCIADYQKDLQPEEGLLCNEFNLRVYELQESEQLCQCTYKKENVVVIFNTLYDDVIRLATLPLDAPCDKLLNDHLHSLHLATEEGEDSIQQLFKSNLSTFRTIAEWHDDHKKTGGRTVLCRHPGDGKDRLECKGGSGRCGCTGDAERRGEVCVLKPGALCDSAGYPYDCSPGEECLFEFCPKGAEEEPCPSFEYGGRRSTSAAEVALLCTPHNKERLPYTGSPKTLHRGCRCTPIPKGEETHHFVRKETFEILNMAAQQYTREKVDQLAEGWEVATYGAKCSWDIDRKYFELKDFIRAGLQHIYYNLKMYYEMAKMVEGWKRGEKVEKVCELERGMRCGFIEEVCGCPTDGYLSEDIPSVYDGGKEICHLPKGSLCHPTLTEWLPCVEGEVCVYKEAGLRCNRENQLEIVKRGVVLKSAKCYCTPGKFEERLGDDMVKRFRKQRRREEF